MYAVTGITGRVGGVVARTLLDTGQSVRVTRAMSWSVQASSTWVPPSEAWASCEWLGLAVILWQHGH